MNTGYTLWGTLTAISPNPYPCNSRIYSKEAMGKALRDLLHRDRQKQRKEKLEKINKINGERK